MDITTIQAIAKSIANNEVVNLAYSNNHADVLNVVCQKLTIGFKITNYWGLDLDGNEWRVALHHKHSTSP